MQHRIYRTAKPFVKWVGGKTQLLGDIERTLPSDFSQKKNVIYVEPFVGGGAVFILDITAISQYSKSCD